MNSEPDFQTHQKILFAETPPKVVLGIRGITVQFVSEGKQRTLRGIPSFKTGKSAFGWRDKESGKIMARPVTLPQHRKWMDLATLSLESQLRSALAITEHMIQTVASPRSWIASRVPLDDSWTWCPDIRVTSELCAPGEEGATITIERIQ